LEFEFFLASELHMCVGEMRDRMTQAEFRRWATYHGRRMQERELKGG
jgi:hypothetical protein